MCWGPRFGAISSFVVVASLAASACRADILYAAVDNTVKKFDSSGNGSVFANSGLLAAVGMAFDGAGNLYVANSVGNTIQKITPAGVGSVFASTGLSTPFGLAFD